MALGLIFLVGGCSKPFHLWQADIFSTSKPQAFDAAKLAKERVVILAPASYNELQGYLPSVTQALFAACAEVSPSIRVISQHDTMNTLSQRPSNVRQLDFGEQ